MILKASEVAFWREAFLMHVRVCRYSTGRYTVFDCANKADESVKELRQRLERVGVQPGRDRL